jgi:DNA-binding NtrC family response regulator
MTDAPPASPDWEDDDAEDVRTATLALHGSVPALLPSSAYVLVVEETAARVVRLPEDGDLIIGRMDEAGVRLDDAAASRQHARLRVAAGAVVVEDLGSLNGTLVNGRRIASPRSLMTGDAIGIGRAAIVVHASPPRAEIGTVVDAARLAERVTEELARARRHGRTLSLIALRLVRPDEATAAVESALAGALCPMELAAWSGPGEIVALVPELGAAAAADYAAALRKVLEPLTGPATAGCATYAIDGCDFAALLAHARARAAAAAANAPAAASATGRELVIGDRRAFVADPAMERLFDLVERLAAGTLPVLVCGETGAGKEVVALALHHWSPRRAAPFVALNCAALPAALVESELFGHERGAFSGAATAKPGLLECAAGGTVFLDEVGDLPLEAQAKLLRAIETHRVTRVGDVRERAVEFRVVTATNRDLEADVAAGRFRRDLFYRLGAATILVPPLRDRTAELPLLAGAFLEQACAERSREAMGISPAAMERLAAHPWPGNVRELRNLMDYVATTVSDDVVQPWHLGRLHAPASGSATGTPAAAEQPNAPLEFRPIADELRELERLRMSQALAATGGNQRRAAELIQMPPRTFTHKLRQYGLGVRPPRAPDA